MQLPNNLREAVKSNTIQTRQPLTKMLPSDLNLTGVFY